MACITTHQLDQHLDFAEVMEAKRVQLEELAEGFKARLLNSESVELGSNVYELSDVVADSFDDGVISTTLEVMLDESNGLSDEAAAKAIRKAIHIQLDKTTAEMAVIAARTL